MSVTHSWSNSTAGTQMTASKTLTPSPEGTIQITDLSVANGATDTQIALGGVDVSQVVSVWMHSTKAITIETNATDATGGNTITLVADVPLSWCTGAPFTNPLTQDITTAYVTNASGAAATINIRIVQDATP